MRKQGYFRKGAKNAEKNRIECKRVKVVSRMFGVDQKLRWRQHSKLVKKYNKLVKIKG